MIIQPFQPVFPVLASDVCLNKSCSDRLSMTKQEIRDRVVQFACRLFSILVCLAFVIAMFTMTVVFAQRYNNPNSQLLLPRTNQELQRELQDAITQLQQAQGNAAGSNSIRERDVGTAADIAELRARVLVAEVELRGMSEVVSNNRDAISVIRGIGLAAISLLGISHMIQLISARSNTRSVRNAENSSIIKG